MKKTFAIILFVILSNILFSQNDTLHQTVKCNINNLPEYKRVDNIPNSFPFGDSDVNTKYYLNNEILYDSLLQYNIRKDINRLRNISADTTNLITIDSTLQLSEYDVIYFEKVYFYTYDVYNRGFVNILGKVTRPSIYKEMFEKINNKNDITIWKYDCFLIILHNSRIATATSDGSFIAKYYLKHK